MMIACERGHFDVVRTLVEAGSQIQLRNAQGKTALNLDYRGDDKEVIPKYLRNMVERPLETTYPSSILYSISKFKHLQHVVPTAVANRPISKSKVGHMLPGKVLDNLVTRLEPLGMY